MRVWAAVFFLVIALCASKNVLFIAGINNKSHWYSMLNVIDSLTAGGHNVTLLRTSFETWKPVCRKCHHYDILVDRFEMKAIALFNTEKRGWAGIFVHRLFQNSSAQLWTQHRAALEHLLHDTKWDLIIVDLIYCAIGNGIAEYMHDRFSVPFAFLSPSVIFYSELEALHLGVTPSSRMTVFPPIPREPYDEYDGALFWPRLRNSLEHILEYVAIRHLEPLLPGPRFHQLITGRPLNWNRLFQKARGILAEDIPKMAYHHPTLQNIVRTSYSCPTLPSPQDAQLPERMRRFIEDPSSKGTIIVAFGTFVDFGSAPASVRTNFFEALASFTEYRIVMQNAGAESLPANFLRNASFLPQKELLVHASARLFISHGGLKSLKEAACAGTPVLVMPVAAEQALNARIVREWQLAETIHKTLFGRDELVLKIRKLLADDGAYRRRGARFARILQDSPVAMPKLALHTANKFMSPFWADQLVKHRGIFLGFREIYYCEALAVVLVAVGVLST